MTRARLLRHRGVVLAVLIAAAVILIRQRRHRVDYSHAQLPSFDAYVYVAMAENPAFFTTAPWGYRVLQPWLVSMLPARHMVRGFRDLGTWSLVLSGGLLFLFLRRLGHGELPSLLGVLAFALSGPIGEALRVPFLIEPLALLLQVAFLLAVEAGAGPLCLALVLLLGVLAKEHLLLLAPLVYLVRRSLMGDGPAARAALVTVLPALLMTLTLRLHWAPYARAPHAPWNLELARAGLEVFWQTWQPTTRALFLGGIAPLAIMGALCVNAQAFLPRYGYLAAAMPAVSLMAWINVPSPTPVPLFAENTLRILIYALPFLIPLALTALDRVWRHMTSPPAPRPPRLVPNLAAGGLAAALLAVPFVGLDRYRRVELNESRDGPLVRATCQESLRVARRLSRGEAVAFDPETQRFAWGVSDAAQAHLMRWYLKRGWGALAHYGTGEVRMHEAQASLLLPSLLGRDLEAIFTLESESDRSLQVLVNGGVVGSVVSRPSPAETSVRVPASSLIRGDNLLSLLAAGDEWRGVRFHRLLLRPAG